LRKRVGDDIEIKEETDSGLIAGFSIALGGVVVDGSLEHKIQEAAKNVQRSAGK
jgi:F0F1-type ATP synthase delta subunit